MASQYAKDVERFDRWAAQYDRCPLQRFLFGPAHSRMLSILAARIDPPGRILDIGCGTGRLLHAASALWPKAKLLGVDPADLMVAEAGRLNPQGDFRIAPAESLPFPDASIDLAMSSLSFHHWADQQKGLHEVARVLCPGGRFCLADHTFTPARLINERTRGRRWRDREFRQAGLSIELHNRIWTRFVLITVAKKSAR